MKFAVLNLCSAKDEDVAHIADAMRLYLNRDVNPEWEKRDVDVEFMPGKTVAPDGWIAAAALEHPDVAGVLGYHDRDPRGVPYIKGFYALLPNRLVLHDPSGKGESLCNLMLHEGAETRADEYANFYADGPFIDNATGRSFASVALELCDPIQECSYTETLPAGVQVDFPDFVTRAWFNAAASAVPFDKMGVLVKPLSLAAGGYVIVRAAQGQDDTVMGKRPLLARVNHAVHGASWRDVAKSHPSSRTARRLAR